MGQSTTKISFDDAPKKELVFNVNITVEVPADYETTFDEDIETLTATFDLGEGTSNIPRKVSEFTLIDVIDLGTGEQGGGAANQ